MTELPVTDAGNEYVLAMQVAASSTFQGVVGAANQTEALEKVHYPCIDFEQDDDGRVTIVVDMLPPRCIISDELGDEIYSQGGINRWHLTEIWWVSFDFPIPENIQAEGTRLNEWKWFRSKYRAILKDIQQLGGTGNPAGTDVSYAKISSAERTEGPYPLDVGEMHLEDPAVELPKRIWHVAFNITRGF